MRFCPACQSVLVTETSTGYVVKHCNRCSKSYEGSADDSLIESNFDPASDIDTSMILKLAPYDRVNKIVDRKCSKCHLKYMTQVVIDYQYTLVCGCGNIVRGDEISGYEKIIESMNK